MGQIQPRERARHGCEHHLHDRQDQPNGIRLRALRHSEHIQPVLFLRHGIRQVWRGHGLRLPQKNGRRKRRSILGQGHGGRLAGHAQMEHSKRQGLMDMELLDGHLGQLRHLQDLGEGRRRGGQLAAGLHGDRHSQQHRRQLLHMRPDTAVLRYHVPQPAVP